MLLATPLISRLNSSAVIVHGIGRKPIMDVTTKSRRNINGSQVTDVVPKIKKKTIITKLITCLIQEPIERPLQGFVQGTKMIEWLL